MREKLTNKDVRNVPIIDMHEHRYGTKHKTRNCFYLILYANFILKTLCVFHMTCKGWMPHNYATHRISGTMGSDI